jgi:hypothetical protein
MVMPESPISLSIFIFLEGKGVGLGRKMGFLPNLRFGSKRDKFDPFW